MSGDFTAYGGRMNRVSGISGRVCGSAEGRGANGIQRGVVSRQLTG